MKKQKDRSQSLDKGELQKLLKRKSSELEQLNRELEIEAALEKVRVIALGMKAPDDMLDICKTISLQLQLLGVKEIRNVQTAIFYVGRGTYMNYEYYAKHKKTFITETIYTNHKVAKAFAAKMLKGKGEISITYIRGKKKVKEWIAYQKTTNVFIDRFLEKASTLNYYWHSLGPVALGISTYVPLKDDALKLFQRFLKVFELSYTRYLDIEQAIAQVKEAKIEVALERVRASTMAMQKSDELAETVHILFQQFKELGENPDQATIGIINEKEKVIEYWVTMYGNQMNKVFKFPFDEPHVTNKIYKAWKKDKKSLVIELSGNALSEFMAYRAGKGGAAINPNEKRRIINVAFFSRGLLNVQSNESRSQESIQLLERFAKVFDQTYTRFLDLQRAEAQAREAKIEATLEKVRSRSLAMHKSDELREVVAVVFEKLQELDFSIDGAAFIITHIENSKDSNIWIADNHDQLYPTSLRLPYYETPSIRDIWTAKESGVDFFSTTYSFEEKNHWFNYAFEHTDIKILSDQLKKWILEQPCLTQAFALAKNSMIGIHFHHQKTLSETEVDILKRFSKVFDQAYIRFLDLQKAEAQAREAQIELGLERVRARAMAMQKTDDLAGAVAIIFEELDKLNIGILRCGIGILNKENRSVNVWTTSQSDEITPVQISGDESMDSHPLLRGAFNAWLKQEEYSYVLHGKDLTDYYQAQAAANFKLPHSQSLITANEDLYQYYFLATFQAGGLFAFRETAFPDEAKKVMKRFAGVFNLTYKRFLDLQKAEAQAREANIEAALERVRSKTMAMHNSQDVADTVVTMFDELAKLGIETFRCGIGIMQEKEQMELWTAKHGEEEKADMIIGRMDMSLHPLLRGAYKGWRNKEEIFSYELKDDDITKYFTAINDNPDYPVKYELSLLPSKIFHHDFYFPEGTLFVFSLEQLTAEASQILKRFSGVFGQTYRRYLDLQKAEAQAREAQIQLAMERVRARTMAMQKSDELTDAAILLFKQVSDLGIKTWTTGFNVWSDDNNFYTDYITTPKGRFLKPYTIDATGFSVLKEVSDAKKAGLDFLVQYVDGDLLKETYNQLSKFGDEKQFELMLEDGFQFPSRQYDHFVFGSKVSLMFITYEPVPEAHDIFKRFAKVFEQTYTRFLDLQKAEAQALEAIKRASVDRVRAEIASMRTTSDLERIQPLIWNELKTLGVPFIRCGVFIMDEEKQEVQTMLSTPEGKAIATLHVPFEFDLTIITNGVQYWRKKEVYKEHWDPAAFRKNWIKLSSLRKTSMDSSQAEHPPENLHLHLLPFLQGMLYVGSDAPLNEDELNLVQNLADAFSTAYARYEDFNKLEAAKQQVDKTLVDLKQAQTQLVQSEKMASLGELTAGIAHEIQNPLNFVNNFSEVSTELVDEMNTEIDKGNLDDAKLIAQDLKQNLEKINHHGKRAGDIVKGMLQHSRSSSGVKEPTDINALADEYLRLAYHGLRAKDKSFNATTKTDFDKNIGNINIIPQDIGRVILNLITNAFYAVTEKKKQTMDDYEPTVSLSTKKVNEKIEVSVKDNGNGIPQKVLDKIFQPFFTTKPTGRGTGLGLSLSYDIVKAHSGELKVETKEGKGSIFIINLPI